MRKLYENFPSFHFKKGNRNYTWKYGIWLLQIHNWGHAYLNYVCSGCAKFDFRHCQGDSYGHGQCGFWGWSNKITIVEFQAEDLEYYSFLLKNQQCEIFSFISLNVSWQCWQILGALLENKVLQKLKLSKTGRIVIWIFMIFTAALACQMYPSSPYKPLSFQTLRHLQFAGNFHSPKFKFSSSRNKMFVCLQIWQKHQYLQTKMYLHQKVNSRCKYLDRNESCLKLADWNSKIVSLIPGGCWGHCH